MRQSVKRLARWPFSAQRLPLSLKRIFCVHLFCRRFCIIQSFPRCLSLRALALCHCLLPLPPSPSPCPALLHKFVAAFVIVPPGINIAPPIAFHNCHTFPIMQCSPRPPRPPSANDPRGIHWKTGYVAAHFQWVKSVGFCVTNDFSIISAF